MFGGDVRFEPGEKSITEDGDTVLDHIVSKAREQDVISRADTPTEERVRAAFLSDVGLSYRRVCELLGYSHEAVRQWSH